MGQSLSQDANTTSPNELDTQRKAAFENASRFELMSLQLHTSRIKSGKVNSVDVSGISGFSGASVLIGMAHSLVPVEFLPNILVAIFWFDGRFVSMLNSCSRSDWERILFRSACTSTIGDEPIMPFENSCSSVHLLISAFDWNPKDFTKQSIAPVKNELTLEILHDFKSPAILVNDFIRSTQRFPYLLAGLANIWDRLLFDERTVTVNKPAKSSSTSSPSSYFSDNLQNALTREECAMVTIVYGPAACEASCLFKGTKMGFSMRAIEASVQEWDGPSISLIQGHAINLKDQNLRSEYAKIDEFMRFSPHVLQKHVKHIKMAIFIDTPWKLSKHTRFGGGNCKIVMFSPSARVLDLPLDPISLKRNLGLAAGPNLHIVDNSTTAPAVIISESIQYGVMRYSSGTSETQYECRFRVDELAIWGAVNNNMVLQEAH